MCERRRQDVPASLGRCAIAGVVSQKRGDYRRERNRPEVMTPVGVPFWRRLSLRMRPPPPCWSSVATTSKQKAAFEAA